MWYYVAALSFETPRILFYDNFTPHKTKNYIYLTLQNNNR